MISNFRDVGGVRTADGSVVRTGVLYRAAYLTGVSEEGLAHLGDLGIRTVIDMRRADEVTTAGRLPDVEGRRYWNVPPMHAMWVHHPGDELVGAARYLADRYLDLARDGGAEYATMLRMIGTEENAPVLVHCYAGKDRTGVLVALALALVGVADVDIAHDYALSDDWTPVPVPEGLQLHWLRAPAEAVMLFLADLREEFGSIDAYATSIGLDETDIAALRAVLVK